MQHTLISGSFTAQSFTARSLLHGNRFFNVDFSHNVQIIQNNRAIIIKKIFLSELIFYFLQAKQEGAII